MKTQLAFLASLVVASTHAAQLPVFPPSNTSDTFFGTRVDDPYRALENEKDPAVASWMKAHADHAHNVLTALPGRDALVKRMTELDSAAAARIGAVDRRPGVTFYTRRGATENVFKLYVRARKPSACWWTPRSGRSAPASRTRSTTSSPRPTAGWSPWASRRAATSSHRST
jgi:hypothetical protein